MAHVKARELFGAWSAWCHVNGEDAGTEKAFAAVLEQRGIEKVKRGSMVYIGIGLAADEDDQ
jgi:putative DNA primase/helicase